ncbi:putative hypothetical protein [Helicobacter mustelae 12198]|uniref:Uncharacterized protein n=1 Tax=Helicobacter mustelae (strain ATCC 43772 / CCUG 25715 / CIP 103759 / LMG 18044 / NCTC 12198 / R85-136P) TaxID=679897 RepID=D3UHY7_HELM1|nr:putative hypothetical protein [Helicobacter mustelae 12198]
MEQKIIGSSPPWCVCYYVSSKQNGVSYDVVCIHHKCVDSLVQCRREIGIHQTSICEYDVICPIICRKYYSDK